MLSLEAERASLRGHRKILILVEDRCKSTYTLLHLKAVNPSAWPGD